MKNLFSILIGPLIVGLILVYVGKETSELSYFLSETIPISLSNSQKTEGSVQLIEVRNTGDKIVKDINIRIDNKVLDYEIIKDSSSNTVKEYRNSKDFELVYSSLPVSGSFKITITTDGKGISQKDIKINHSEGQAKNTLEENNFSIEFYMFCSLIIFYSLFIIKEIKLSHLESNSHFRNGAKGILGKSKPFYCGEERWNKIRKNSINNFFDNNYFYESSIQDLPIYTFLNSDKPSYLLEEDWGELKRNSIKILKETILKNSLDSYLDHGTINKFLRLKKPMHFPIDLWEELTTTLNKKYLAIKKDAILFLSIDELKNYNLNKPAEISELIWEKFLYDFKKIYVKKIEECLVNSNEPLELLKEHDISIFETYYQNNLKDLAQNVALIRLECLFESENASKFLEEEINKEKYNYKGMYTTLKGIAEKSILLQDKIESYEGLIAVINNIVKKGEIPDNKPITIEQKVWENAQELHKRIEFIRNNEENLRRIENELEPKMYKVEKQLEIIHRALLDPSAIDRIEDYSNVFALGNYENLKKVVILNNQIQTLNNNESDL